MSSRSCRTWSLSVFDPLSYDETSSDLLRLVATIGPKASIMNISVFGSWRLRLSDLCFILQSTPNLQHLSIDVDASVRTLAFPLQRAFESANHLTTCMIEHWDPPSDTTSELIRLPWHLAPSYRPYLASLDITSVWIADLVRRVVHRNTRVLINTAAISLLIASDRANSNCQMRHSILPLIQLLIRYWDEWRVYISRKRKRDYTCRHAPNGSLLHTHSNTIEHSDSHNT